MINNTKLYCKGYQSDLIRGIDEPRPWVLETEILQFVTPETIMLDIGCGAAKKLVPLAKHVKQIIALEPSEEMRELAQETLSSNNIKNIEIVAGFSNDLPFQSHSFDLVTCMLAPWDWNEVCRVLKNGGHFVNETIGCEDKIEFKHYFGKDAHGNWRGQLLQFQMEDFLKIHTNELQNRFSNFEIRNGIWNTYYTPEGLLELCKYTPTIKDFDAEKDKSLLEAAIKAFTTEQGIKLRQNRLLMMATL